MPVVGIEIENWHKATGCPYPLPIDHSWLGCNHDRFGMLSAQFPFIKTQSSFSEISRYREGQLNCKLKRTCKLFAVSAVHNSLCIETKEELMQHDFDLAIWGIG